MTKTNTRNRIVSILLVLAMLLTMVPITAVTAFAAGNYPDYVRVYNGNNQITSLSDGQYLAANDATSQSSGYDGTQTYVARYDKSMGTLYLKGYQGVATEDSIFAGGDLNIVVEGDSSFTTSTTTTGNLYGIQADGGKLNISGSGKLTVTANGDGDVYGIYAKEGVTISAPLDVTVGENDTTKNGSVYGIYTKSGAISLSGEDKTITATGGVGNVYGVYNAADTSTIADNGNIDISGKLTVKPSNGKYNRGISSQGGVITLDGATVRIPGNYYYGIYNENGNVIIKNGSDVDISSDISSNRGIITENGGSLTIDKSIVKVSSNGIVAEIYENASIKDSTVDLTLTDNHYEVIRADSTAANTIDLSGSGSVTLTATGKQDYAMFGGKVTLGTNTKCEKGTAISSWNNYAGEYDAVSNTTVLKFVHESAAPATYTVSFDANGGTGTMADVTGISGEYTLPANGFTAPAGKQFKGWSVGGVEKAVGDKITVTANTTVTAVWEAIEYNVTVTGGTASVGAGTPITKATMGTTVTLTANAAPTDMVFDKWEVISGSITLADANSATTTFTMPAGAVSVKATYTTYITVNLAAGEGSGTMEPIITKNTYGYFSLTAPECTFTAPANKVFDKWQFSKDDSYLKPGDTKTIWSSADGATLTAIWKDAPVTEYDITVTDGKATVGAGTEITKATMGTTVTLTAGAAPSGKVFDKWEVVSGGITLADAYSATTTFTMPASAVSVKATYKNAPHTHTYNQETVKPEALKTPADCTHNAVYFKSCSCGAISTTDTFVAMNTTLGHAYGSDWKYDSTNHWHECSRCHDKKDEAAHSASEWIIDTAATETAEGAKHKECTVCKKVLETATIPALVKINAEHLTAAKPVKGAAAAKATTTDSTYYVANTEWTAADGTILTVGQNFNAGTVYTVKITLKAKENNVFAADSTYNKIEGKDAKLETAVTGHTDSVILTYTFDATEGVAYNITKGANGVWVKGSTDTLSFTADGEYAKFTSVKIDGAELAAENYTAAAGSTVITLKNEYLSTLAVGAHTIAIIYTDGDCSTNFTVHQHTYGAWSSDDTHHWHECTDASCTNIADKAEHTFEWKIDVPASQASTGTKHEECTVCGKKRNENTVIDKLPGSGSGSHHSSNNSNNNNNTGTEAAAPEAAAPAPAASAPVTTTTSARTGDSSNLIGWLTVLLISGGAAVAWYTVAKKKKEQ